VNVIGPAFWVAWSAWQPSFVSVTLMTLAPARGLVLLAQPPAISPAPTPLPSLVMQ
jgi:hypothetical protein